MRGDRHRPRDTSVPGSSSSPQGRAIDLAFAAAWPALESDHVSDWLLRASGGVTRRANSALALETPADLDGCLSDLERWYGARGLCARIQIVPTAPPDLVGELASRGWIRQEGRCSVETAFLAALATNPDRPAVVAASEPTPAWVATWWEVSPRGGEAERRIAERILAGVPAPRRFSISHLDGTPVACALGVVTHGVLVVESVATLPDARRRGACRALVYDLALWARGLGADQAVLSVELANDKGRAVWDRLGFRPIGEWFYLTR